jgi:TatD DNase family protein
MSAYIDTHCHLDLFRNILKDKQIEDKNGIKTITVTNAPSFFKPNCELFDGSSNIRVGLGLHPQLVTQHKGEVKLFEELINDTRYIGEIGLDGSNELKGTYELQKNLFLQILEIIKSHKGKILTVHSRNAGTDTIEALSRVLIKDDNKVILHWYSGSITDLKLAIGKGFYFSINHRMVATEKGKLLISHIPDYLLLTETDAPFTFSGAANTRLRCLKLTINGIGTQKSRPSEDIKNLIYGNFKTLLS